MQKVESDKNPNRPRAQEWDAYAEMVRAAWAAALDAEDEATVQRCLEQHPCLLPLYGSNTAGGGGHHGHWMDVVVTQPPLPGYQSRVPDFLWVERDSGSVTVVCVELERPNKFWFNVDGSQTSDLTQALGQIGDWRDWFQTNRSSNFFDAFQIPRQWSSRVFRQRYVLLYGRAREFESEVGSRHGAEGDRLNRIRQQLNSQPDLKVNTLDSLVPNKSHSSTITVKRTNKRLAAVAVPPTFETGQQVLQLARHVERLSDAIGKIESVSAERRDYLIERLGFWREAPLGGSYDLYGE